MLYHCWLYAVPRTWNHNTQWVRDTTYIYHLPFTDTRNPYGGVQHCIRFIVMRVDDLNSPVAKSALLDYFFLCFDKKGSDF